MGKGTDEPDGKPRAYIRGKEDRSHGAVIASTSNDLTLDTGSFEYSNIKDKTYPGTEDLPELRPELGNEKRRGQ